MSHDQDLQWGADRSGRCPVFSGEDGSPQCRVVAPTERIEALGYYVAIWHDGPHDFGDEPSRAELLNEEREPERRQRGREPRGDEGWVEEFNRRRSSR